MSYENAVPTDCIYAYHNASTNLATFTTEDNLQKTYPPVILRAGTWLNAQATGKNLRIRAAGQLGTTSAPTFTWSIRLLTSTTWSAGGVLLGSTAATTAGTTVTLAGWFLDAQIGLRTLGIGGASTVVTTGEVRGPLALASPFAASIPASNTSPAVATVDNSTQYYLFISAACGSSNSLNLINMQSRVVTADN
jgi:hypothetical protein